MRRCDYCGGIKGKELTSETDSKNIEELKHVLHEATLENADFNNNVFCCTECMLAFYRRKAA